MATAKTFNVEVIVPEGLVAGDVFTVEVTAPELPKQTRGQLHGIALNEMTDEQLKIELINSKSVLYKAKKRGADQATIDAAEARVEAAKAEKANRVGTAPVEETTTDEEVDENPEM